MMKRFRLIAGIVLAGAFVTVAVTMGPQWLSGYRVMKALDHHYAAYAANGGPWPQPQDTCTFCHGTGGQPQNDRYAALAGQPVAYIQAQLQAFASGHRQSPQMGPLAASLSDTQVLTLAEYFARQRPAVTEMPGQNDALAQRGRGTVAARGCSACHAGDLSGGPLGPRIAGQGKTYLMDQLRAFRLKRRQDPNQTMNAVASQLSDDELEAVAHYLAGLAPVAH